MFAGREQELKDVLKVLDESHGTVLVYGMEGEGKTAFILEALKGSTDKTILFRCRDSTLEENAGLFTALCIMAGIMPQGMAFDSFGNVIASKTLQYTI